MTAMHFVVRVQDKTRGKPSNRPRNDRLVDKWSFTHIAWGIVLTIALGPVLAFLILLAWEPFEVLVLSPVAARVGVDFGHEHWRNSLSDIAFNGIGVGAAWIFILPAWNPFGVA